MILAEKPVTRNLGYCLQVMAAMGFALLPVWLQGHFNFIQCGIEYYLLLTVLLTALWLRCRLPVQLCLPAVFAACLYSGYVLIKRDDIGYNVICAILNTNLEEALPFLKDPRISLSLCLVLVVFAALSWALCSKRLRAKTAMSVRLNAFILYLVMVSCGWAYLKTGSGWNKQQMYPVNLVCEGYRFIREVQYAKEMHSRLNYTYAGPDAAHARPP